MIINARTLESFRQETKFFGFFGANVYIYEVIWIAGKKFEKTQLPPKNASYSKLNMKGVSDQDY